MAVEQLYLDTRIIQLVGMGGRKRLHVALIPNTVKLVYMYRVGSHPSPIHIGRYTVREGTALRHLRSL